MGEAGSGDEYEEEGDRGSQGTNEQPRSGDQEAVGEGTRTRIDNAPGSCDVRSEISSDPPMAGSGKPGTDAASSGVGSGGSTGGSLRPRLHSTAPVPPMTRMVPAALQTVSEVVMVDAEGAEEGVQFSDMEGVQ